MYCIFIILLLQLCASVEPRSAGRYDFHNHHIKTHNKPAKHIYCPYNMCEDVENYPEKEMIKMLDKRPEYHTHFGSMVEPSSLPIEIFSRNGYNYAELCSSRNRTRKPRSMEDHDGIQRLIVNAGNYTQYVSFEECIDQGPCSQSCNPDEKSYCVQKYIKIVLLTMDPENHEFSTRKFNIPSTCACLHAK